MKRITAALLVLLLSGAGQLGAAGYFVSLDGDDAGDGLSRETAFARIQRGVDALAPGDTLTIMPGEYFESVIREDLGGPDADTVIRAALAGTVLLRGDAPAPQFRPAPGYRFVYAAEFPQTVQAVNELDTLSILESVPNPGEVEFRPGSFHYDGETRTLYISASDLQPPDRHRYTVSVLEGSGFFLVNPERVVLEGLAATGFHNAVALPRRRAGHMSGDPLRHGFYLWRARRSTVRDCRAYFNGGGITILTSREGGGNLIEGCAAWANYSKYGDSVGNIVILDWSEDEVRDSVAHRGRNHGIRLYGSGGAGLVRDNLSWGHLGADFQVKGGDGVRLTRVERCLAPTGAITSPNATDSLVGSRGDNEGNNLVFSLEANLDPAAEFADPENHDYRLQATSRFRGAGLGGVDRGPFPFEANIFYLSPAGDDAADGLSAARAWRSWFRALPILRAGDTLYLAGGLYPAGPPAALRGTLDRPVAVRGRGRERVVIEGGFELVDGAHVNFERLDFTGGVRVTGGRAVAFENCRMTGGDAALTARGTDGLRLSHCLFSDFRESGLALAGASDVFLQGNIFDNRTGAGVSADRPEAVIYSDYNAYCAAETAWRSSGAAGPTLPLTALVPARERYSSAIRPELRRENGAPVLLNPMDFALAGPFGRPAGPDFSAEPGEALLRLHGPFVHSVTDTTANFEWWLSVPARFEISWGVNPAAPENSVRRNSNLAGTFSLAGLTPDTDYFVRFKPDRSFERIAADEPGDPDADGVTIAFRTAAGPALARVYHVAPDGDDAADGLGRATAWRTVGHAADRVRPGDTVLVGGGTYHEAVRVRTTGEAGRPITFRAAPGEKVVLHGFGHALDFAFLALDKSYLRFDGFYFVEYHHGSDQLPWLIDERSSQGNGHIVLADSRDCRITRCFSDGRLVYAPGLLLARFCPDLVIENNVVLNAMGATEILRFSPRSIIRHNVFLRNLIHNLSVGTKPRQAEDRSVIENNIITDNLATKLGVALGLGANTDNRDNCFYLRVPAAERGWGGVRTFADMLAGLEAGDRTMVVDPLFRGTLEWERVDAEGKPVFLADRLLGKRDLDFPDLFATNPDLAEHGIGLQPEAFADFHFNR